MKRLLFCAFLLAGCPQPTLSDDDDDATGDDDDATDAGPAPVVVSIEPATNSSGVALDSNVVVTFDIAPEATIEVYVGSTLVAGEQTLDGAEVTFDPTNDFGFETIVRVSVNWNHPSSPVESTFTTLPAPTGIEDPSTLVGVPYVLDLAAAEFVLPPNVGPILVGFLPEEPILLGIGPESDLSEGGQPGLHMSGAEAGQAKPPYAQIDCRTTFPLTWGFDGDLGTPDDRPATFNNPDFDLGPTVLRLDVSGVQTELSNLVIEGEFAEDGSTLSLSRFTGILDTRGLSTGINPDGGPGVACDLLLELAGVECEECGAPNPGPYCTEVETEPMVLPRQDDVPFDVVDCDDVIERFFDGGECVAEAAEFDLNGGGFYELCPEWEG